MPSGYTSDLYEGEDVSFEKFVLQCARGMGAAMTAEDIAEKRAEERRLSLEAEARDRATYEKLKERFE